MSDKLLKISIQRFEAGKAFSQDVFLHLALNGRFVRVAASGDDISPALLSRMSAKGVTHLHVATNGDAGLDPETFPIYSSTGPGTPSLGEPIVVMPGAADSSPAAPAVSPAEAEAAVKISKEDSAPEAEQKFSPDAPTAETSQTFSSTPEAKLEEIRFGASKDSPEGSVTIKASKEDKKPEESLVFSNKAELENEGNLILAKLKNALIAEKLSLEANIFRKAVVATPIKDRKKHRRDFTGLSEAADRVTGDKIDALTERKFDIEKEIAPFRLLATKPSEEALAEASDRIVLALKELPMGQKHLKEANRMIAESEEMRESPALAKLSKKLEKAPKNDAEKAQLLQDVKNTLMVNKISDEIMKFAPSKAEAEPEQRFSPELAVLERALETVSAGGKLPEEVERRFSADKEAEEIVTVFSSDGGADAASKINDQIKIAADRREQAMEELHKQKGDGSLVRAKTHRDLPNTASRLAAYLGYCLGYTNLSMLSDLALTAVLHFAKKDDEIRLSESEIPLFVKNQLSSKVEHDFVSQDANEIIQILDAYLSNPECDREQKDFVKRIFDQTIETMLAGETEFDAINVAKWSKFVEKGTDLHGHSICVKASANAVKLSKSIII